MSLFGFIKDAGERLFGGDKEATPQAATTQEDNTAQAEALNTKAAQAIAAYVQSQDLNISNLQVAFDGSTSTVTLQGEAANQETAEKAVLCCGNVRGVDKVDNQLTVAENATQARFHDVERGDTLSAIAKQYYGNASAYMKIFEANKPMLSDPDKIYPGQKLRIPE